MNAHEWMCGNLPKDEGPEPDTEEMDGALPQFPTAMSSHGWLGSELDSTPPIMNQVRFWDSCATLTDDQLAAGKRDQLAPVKPEPKTAVKAPASTLQVTVDMLAQQDAIERKYQADVLHLGERAAANKWGKNLSPVSV